VRVPFDLLAEAKLILTDDLVREALRRDKELRRAADEGDDGADETTETPN
jgi:ribosome maturation factor RimP